MKVCKVEEKPALAYLSESCVYLAHHLTTLSDLETGLLKVTITYAGKVVYLGNGAT